MQHQENNEGAEKSVPYKNNGSSSDRIALVGITEDFPLTALLLASTFARSTKLKHGTIRHNKITW